MFDYALKFRLKQNGFFVMVLCCCKLIHYSTSLEEWLSKFSLAVCYFPCYSKFLHFMDFMYNHTKLNRVFVGTICLSSRKLASPREKYFKYIFIIQSYIKYQDTEKIKMIKLFLCACVSSVRDNFSKQQNGLWKPQKCLGFEGTKQIPLQQAQKSNKK